MHSEETASVKTFPRILFVSGNDVHSADLVTVHPFIQAIILDCMCYIRAQWGLQGRLRVGCADQPVGPILRMLLQVSHSGVLICCRSFSYASALTFSARAFGLVLLKPTADLLLSNMLRKRR
jgi:hypothetical protein